MFRDVILLEQAGKTSSFIMGRLSHQKKVSSVLKPSFERAWWLRGKASACNAGDLGSTSGSGRSPGKGNGNTLQYSCLENPMDGGAW